jgi:hypothetical protein
MTVERRGVYLDVKERKQLKDTGNYTMKSFTICNFAVYY